MGDRIVDEKQALELAKTIAPDCDLKVEFNLPENCKDCEVKLIGKPILALNPATNNLVVPARFLHHPLVEDRFFFTIPVPLWGMIFRQLGKDALGEGAVELEQTLSEIGGDHWSRAGFWKGLAFSCDLLCAAPKWKPSAEDAKSAGWEVNQAKLDNVMRICEKRTEGFGRTARAYAGWLLTNRVFLDEHDALFTQWSNMVRRWGLNRLGILLPKGGFLPGDDATADPQWPDFSTAFNEFFARWRLQGFAAPYLPIPLQPLMSGSFPMSVVPQVNRAGGTYCLPDTFPVPSRDDLRNMLEDSLHGSDKPDYLAEWMELIDGHNSAKKPLIKFARLFALQHYWRILNQRHCQAIGRKHGILKEVLGRFLEVSWDTIHRDLLFINKRLEKGWTDRGTFPFGPF